MRRRDNADAWQIHTAGTETGATASSDLSPALIDITNDDEGARFAQDIRESLVNGLRRDDLLRRIREHFAETSESAHVRHTRRACLELQGRRRTTRPTHVQVSPAA